MLVETCASLARPADRRLRTFRGVYFFQSELRAFQPELTPLKLNINLPVVVRTHTGACGFVLSRRSVQPDFDPHSNSGLEHASKNTSEPPVFLGLIHSIFTPLNSTPFPLR